MLNGKEALELAILEYEKDLEFDENNQWVKNVLKGLKKCEQDLERLEKLEKVIDILENKIVNILILKYCIAKGGGVETYNLHYKTEEQITQEEYDLIKEELENDK